jgi:hypothetical protein
MKVRAVPTPWAMITCQVGHTEQPWGVNWVQVHGSPCVLFFTLLHMQMPLESGWVAGMVWKASWR